jgi:integrase
LRAAMKALPDGGMMLARLDVALDCGLRRGEMLALTIGDVKWNHQGKGVHLHVRWTTSKTNYERFVPASARVERFLKSRRLITGRIYGQFDGAPISESQFRDDWESVLAAAAVNDRVRAKSANGWDVWKLTYEGDLHWHDLRHEACSRLAETGIDPRALMSLMGHLTFATTARYINHTTDHLRAAMQRVAKSYGIR